MVLTEKKSEFREYLEKNGVMSGDFYPIPLHKQIAFNTEGMSLGDCSLPVAERISEQTVCMPIFPEMTDEEVKYVIEVANRF